MVDQNALDRNLFAIKHPRTDDGYGELILGSVDEAFTDSLVTLPLPNINGGKDVSFNAFASAEWQVAASSLSLASYKNNPSLVGSLPNYIAVFSNSYTNVMFPQPIADRMGSHLNWSNYLDNFSCNNRNSFPNLTIVFGSQQHEFELSPSQYMHEIINPKRQTRCILPFSPLYKEEEHPDYTALGSAFLASWYSKFDFDRGASKSFKSSKEARIELNCLAFQIRRIRRIELTQKVQIGIKLTN